MKNTTENRPRVISHQPIRFETAKSNNPGIGNVTGSLPKHPIGPQNPGLDTTQKNNNDNPVPKKNH